MKILVTDTEELSGLAVVRSLGRAGHRVTAGHRPGVHPAAMHSRWCFGACSYPDPWRHHPQFQKWLIHELSNGAYDAVFPVTEATVHAASAIRNALPQKVLSMMPSDKNLLFALSKYHVNRAALDSGIPVPKTIFVSDGSKDTSFNDDLSGLTFPLIIKSDNVLTKDGVYIKGKHLIVRDMHEASGALSECKALGAGVIAQDIAPGTGVGVSVLRWNGKIYLTFSHRRIHEVPWTGGASSYRASMHDFALEELTKKLLETIDYEGIAMVEFRRESLNAAPYLMEINGRPWGSLALALHAGVDFPAALVDCVTNGQPAEKRRNAQYPDNIRCRHIPGEIKYMISVMRASRQPGHPSPPSKIKAFIGCVALSFNPRIRADYFWWKDPMPGLVQAALVGLDLKGGLINAIRRLFFMRKNRTILRHAAKPSFSSPPRNILFLCFGNICRSAFAQMYWNQRLAPGCHATSAGLCEIEGRSVPDQARPIMESFGIDIASHTSIQVTKAMIEKTDAIFLMDIKNWHGFMKVFPEARQKTFFLGVFYKSENIEIPDPCDRCPHKFNPVQAQGIFRKIVQSLDGLRRHIQ